MTAPVFNEIYSSAENAHMNAPIRKFQEMSTFTSNIDITLKTPVVIVNATNTAANIAYKLVDDYDAYIVEHFLAGQEKRRRVITGSGTGGIGAAAAGTTCTKVFVGEA